MPLTGKFSINMTNADGKYDPSLLKKWAEKKGLALDLLSVFFLIAKAPLQGTPSRTTSTLGTSEVFLNPYFCHPCLSVANLNFLFPPAVLRRGDASLAVGNVAGYQELISLTMQQDR